MPAFFNQFAGWGEELFWGTAVARTQFSRIQKGTLNKKEIPREPGTELGFRDVQRMRTKLIKGMGKLLVPLAFDQPGFDLLLKHCFGNVSGAGTIASPFIFTLEDDPYTRSSSPLVGLTVELFADLKAAGQESLILEGGRVTEFGVEFNTDEVINLDVDLVGETVEEAADTAAPTFPDLDTNEITTAQVTVQLDDVATSVVSLGFRCNHNLRTDRGFLGSQFIAAPIAGPGRRLITGTISKEWENRDLYNAFLNKTPVKIEAICTDGTHTWTWLMPKAIFTGETPEPEEGESMPQNIPFTLIDDATDGAMKLTMNDAP